jgi:hypothetical protein
VLTATGTSSNVAHAQTNLTFNGTTLAVTGNVGIGTTAPIAALDISSGITLPFNINRTVGGQNNFITLQSSGTTRWGLGFFNAATGSGNGGNDFNFISYTDAGGLLSTPVVFQRSTGRVGIGNTNPQITLDISSASADQGVRVTSSNAQINLRDPGSTSPFQMYQNNVNQGFYVSNALPVFFYQSNGIRMAIRDGNVGIGTSFPSNTLDVNGDARVVGDVRGNAFFSQQFTTASIPNGVSAAITAWSNVMPANATTYSCLVGVVANIAGSFANVGGALYAVVQYSTGTYAAVQLAQSTNGGITFTPSTSNISLDNNVGSAQVFNVNFTVLGSNR